jgi:hypothetical protein
MVRETTTTTTRVVHNKLARGVARLAIRRKRPLDTIRGVLESLALCLGESISQYWCGACLPSVASMEVFCFQNASMEVYGSLEARGRESPKHPVGHVRRSCTLAVRVSDTHWLCFAATYSLSFIIQDLLSRNLAVGSLVGAPD